ncbi:MAG: hypothetical protein OXC68_09690, partial [Aestuariivita sp.]|nr:hypothetical protein [Aestuariivita sp.]
QMWKFLSICGLDGSSHKSSYRTGCNSLSDRRDLQRNPMSGYPGYGLFFDICAGNIKQPRPQIALDFVVPAVLCMGAHHVHECRVLG